MFIAIFSSIEAGIIYALMALGVYLSFRILDFPDLTVDGSFVTGAAVAALMIVSGYSPFTATIVAMFAGFLAGCVTGILHTKGKINPLLSGILMMIALYSINLRIMGGPAISLLKENTIFSTITDVWQKIGLDTPLNGMLKSLGLAQVPKTWAVVFFVLLITIIVKILLDQFLKTEIGLAIRATGDNEKMIRSFSANTDTLIILGQKRQAHLI
ncbi:MAG TPA: ABC transporter permease, partial [Bacilli bacterium]|nr:ABC transporter permease [Bacilli bacterium]